MPKVNPVQRGRVVFFTFQNSNDAKNFINTMKEKEKKMAEAINEIGKQAQVLHEVNTRLRTENKILTSALVDAYDQLAVFFGVDEEEEEEEKQEEKQEEDFSSALNEIQVEPPEGEF